MTLVLLLATITGTAVLVSVLPVLLMLAYLADVPLAATSPEGEDIVHGGGDNGGEEALMMKVEALEYVRMMQKNKSILRAAEVAYSRRDQGSFQVALEHVMRIYAVARTSGRKARIETTRVLPTIPEEAS